MARIEGLKFDDEGETSVPVNGLKFDGTGTPLGAIAMPTRPAKRDALGAGMERFKSGIRSGIPLAIGTALDNIDPADQQRYMEDLRTSAQRQEELLPGGPKSYKDVRGVGGALEFVGENLAFGAPQIGVGVAGAVAGAAAGSVVPGAGTAAGGIGGAIGAIAASTPGFVGSNVQAATEDGSIDLTQSSATKSIAVAPAQAALDVAVGKFVPGIGKLLPGPAVSQTGGIIARSAKNAAGAAVTEGVTESLQQVGERFAGEKSLTSVEALREYLDSGVTGALLGGTIGGATGPFMGKPKPIADVQTGETPEPEVATPVVPDPPGPVSSTGLMPQPQLEAPEAYKPGTDANLRKSILDTLTAATVADGTPQEIDTETSDGKKEPGVQQYVQALGMRLSTTLLAPDVDKATTLVEREKAKLNKALDTLADEQASLDEGKAQHTPEEQARYQASIDTRLNKLAVKSNVLLAAAAKVGEFRQMLDPAVAEPVASVAEEPVAAPDPTPTGPTLVTEPEPGQRFGRKPILPGDPNPTGLEASDTGFADDLTLEAADTLSADTKARVGLLDTVLGDTNTRDPMRRYVALLKRKGMAANITEQEAERIARYEAARDAFTDPDQPDFMTLPSAPDEGGGLGIKEKPAAEAFGAEPEVPVAEPAPAPAPVPEEKITANVETRVQEQADTMGSSQRAWFLKGANAEMGVADTPAPADKSPKGRWFKQGQEFVQAERARQEREKNPDPPPPPKGGPKVEKKAKPKTTVADQLRAKQAAKKAEAKPEPKPAPKAEVAKPEPAAETPTRGGRKQFDTAVAQAEQAGKLDQKTGMQLRYMAEAAWDADMWRALDDAIEQAKPPAKDFGKGKPKFSKADDGVDPKVAVRMALWERFLRLEMDRMGLDDVQLFVTSGTALYMLYGTEARGAFSAEHETDGLGHLIEVAYDLGKPSQTLYHEAIHAMREMNLIAENEWTDLAKAAMADTQLFRQIQRYYPDLDTDGQVEEAVAEMFAKWQQERRITDGTKNPWVRTFRKVKAFLVALKNSLTRAGYKNAEQVMRDIESGALGSRERGPTRQQGGRREMFVGERSRTANKGKLVGAKMTSVASGAQAEFLRRVSGWSKGADGEWRYEISDDGAKLKNWANVEEQKAFTKAEKTYTLADVLDHPTLFKAYPELADVKVTKQRGLWDIFGSYQGWFTPSTNILNVTPNADDPLGTMLHEIQHWVQGREDWAQGGSPDNVRLDNDEALQKLGDYYGRLSEEEAEFIAASKLAGKPNAVRPVMDARREKLANMQREDGEFIRELYRALDKNKQAVDDLKVEMFDTMQAVAQKHEAAVAEYEATHSRLTKEIDATFKEKMASYDNGKWKEPGYGDAMNEKLDALRDERRQLERPYRDWAAERAMREDFEAKLKRAEDSVKAQRDAIGALGKQYSDLTYDLYKLLAGEVEARDTTHRKDMTKEQRRATPPGAHEGIRQREQIVRRELGPNGDTKFARSMEPDAVVKKSQAQLAEVARSWGNTGRTWLADTRDLAKMAKKFLPSAQKIIDLHSNNFALSREFEERLLDVKNAYEALPHTLKGNGPGSMNRLLYDMRMQGEWAFKPDYQPAAKVSPELAKRFDALPKEAQAVVKSVMRFNFDARAQLYDATTKAINAEYEELLADAPDSKKDEIGKSKARALANNSRVFDTRDGLPYTPLKRTGSFSVVGKSEEFRKAEAEKDYKTVEKLRADPEHYYVNFTDSRLQALKMQENLTKQFGKEGAYYFARDEVTDTEVGGTELYLAFQKLISAIEDNDEHSPGSRAAKEVKRMATDLYLHTLAETSARKGEMKADLVSAVDPVTGEAIDMMQAFVTRGHATTRYISSISNNAEMQDALRATRNELRSTPAKDRTQAQEFYNELIWRYASNLTYKPNALISRATWLVSVWNLLTSPFYYLQNASQSVLLSQPLVAAKYGYAKAHGEFGKAYGDFFSMIKDTELTDLVDLKKAPADVREVLNAVRDAGLIDAGLNADLTEVETLADTQVGEAWNKVSKMLRRLPQRVETMNRVVTAMASYRAAVAGGATPEAATEFAKDVIHSSHGDYSRFNSPRPFHYGGIARIALQFRKFQFIMAAMWAREFHRTFKGATKEERVLGLRAMGFITAHMAAIGGAVGIPGAALFGPMVMAILNAFDEDDDKDYSDWKQSLRKALGTGDSWLADLMYKGAPYALGGVDMSDRLGMGNMLSVAPYTDADTALTGREEFQSFSSKLLLGATGGLLAKGVDAFGFAREGDTARVVESIMPSGASNIMKAKRLDDEGLTARNGDELFSADDISGMDKVWTALGVTPSKLSDQREARAEAFDIEQKYKGETTRLKRMYAKAAKREDGVRMADVREQWEAVQEARVRDGLTKQPLSTLLKSPTEQEKREDRVIEGVPYQKSTKGMVEILTGEVSLEE